MYLHELSAPGLVLIMHQPGPSPSIGHFESCQMRIHVQKLHKSLQLYADDTIIMAESSHELQAALNCLNHYCNIWKLKVNVSKTKVVIFANRQPNTYHNLGLETLYI